MGFKRTYKKTKIEELVDDLRQLCTGKTVIELRAMYTELRYQYREASRILEALESTKFNRGDPVSFETKHGTLMGIVKTVNKRSLTLHECSDGRIWRVHFSYCTKITQQI